MVELKYRTDVILLDVVYFFIILGPFVQITNAGGLILFTNIFKSP